MWNDVKFEPGKVIVKVFDKDGNIAGTDSICTAGAPDHIELIADRTKLESNGKDLSYINVRIVDKEGNLCPNENGLIRFSVEGNATFRASANGDPTCLDSFQEPQMHLFNGQLTAIVQSSNKRGKATFTASTDSLPNSELRINIKK